MLAGRLTSINEIHCTRIFVSVDVPSRRDRRSLTLVVARSRKRAREENEPTARRNGRLHGARAPSPRIFLTSVYPLRRSRVPPIVQRFRSGGLYSALSFSGQRHRRISFSQIQLAVEWNGEKRSQNLDKICSFVEGRKITIYFVFADEYDFEKSKNRQKFCLGLGNWQNIPRFCTRFEFLSSNGVMELDLMYFAGRKIFKLLFKTLPRSVASFLIF